MYTTLPEIWEGWTKNIFLGMRDQLGLLSFGAFVGLLGALALPAWLLSGLLWLLLEGSPAAAIVVTQAVLASALLIYYRIQAADAFNIPALLCPDPAAGLSDAYCHDVCFYL
jgi:hypothetical protein